MVKPRRSSNIVEPFRIAAICKSDAATGQGKRTSRNGPHLAFKFPMRDGIRLNGTVFESTGKKEPLPVIFTLTPYISDTYQNRASYFSQHGYVFVLVDWRRRGSPFAEASAPGGSRNGSTEMRS